MAHEPKPGSTGTYLVEGREPVGFTVSSVEGNLCWAVYDTDPTAKAAPFIWRFKDGLNSCHDWSGKLAVEGGAA